LREGESGVKRTVNGCVFEYGIKVEKRDRKRESTFILFHKINFLVSKLVIREKEREKERYTRERERKRQREREKEKRERVGERIGMGTSSVLVKS